MLKAAEQKQIEISELRRKLEGLISSKNDVEEQLRLSTEAANRTQLKAQKEH